MSENIDADVSIILRAEDRASEEVNAAAGRINRSYREMSNQQRALTNSFRLQHRTFNDTIQGLQLAGRVAGTVTHVFNTLNIMELRRLETARDLKKAQEDVNKALADYGPNSAQYRKAKEEEIAINRRAQVQQQQDILTYAGLGIQTAGSVAQIGRSSLVQRGLARIGGLGPITAGGAVAAGAAGAGAAALLAPQALAYQTLAENPEDVNVSSNLPHGASSRFGYLRKQALRKKQGAVINNQTVNINTNEIGVTSGDIINGMDVLGSDY